MLRLLLVRHGIPEPLVNAPIRDGFGRVIAHGDLVWPAQKVVVEYDGRHHAEDVRQFGIDIRRINAIEAEGWRVIRVDLGLLREPAVLLALVRAALAR